MELALPNSERLLYNTRTDYLVTLDDSLYRRFDRLDLTSEEAAALHEMGFIIEDGADELKALRQDHFTAKRNGHELHLVIQTSTGCNFACTYCYQNHSVKNLEADGIRKLQSFVLAKLATGVTQLTVHWFGGEPLLNMEVIFTMEEWFKELSAQYPHLSYFSSITTNGYLLKSPVIDRLERETRISSIQVTLDGPAELHNRSRQLKNGSGTYEAIFRNLRELLVRSARIHVTLRYNVTQVNIHYIKPFLEGLEAAEMLYHPRLELNFQKVHNYNGNAEDESGVYFASKEDYAAQLLDVYRLLADKGLTLPRYTVLKKVHCDFEKRNTAVVGPDMNLYICTASDFTPEYSLGLLGENGSITDERPSEMVERNIFAKDKCLSCRLLPLCMGGCSKLEAMGEDECIPERYIFLELLKLYYQEQIGAGALAGS
ncbi:radical SAM/SPASM domain-containing protein [Paenibacillus tengchongensis]|uniref:radical SAM/SPASM domain-containing protein n=1 Tax=Paenibacillus tengchongensis TaxID=2608684 RepID=UPI001C9E6B3C|nr:radical SAM protein [Paenibacillus tengchongensis]